MESLSRDYKNLNYLAGLGNHHATEAVKGTLPVGQNNPQKCPHGLYAEQLSGSSFTQQRHTNFRSWLYRIKPSVTHRPFKACEKGAHPNLSNRFSDEESFEINPNQLRWKPMKFPEAGTSTNFLEGLLTVGGTGDPSLKEGICIYQYACNKSMSHESLMNSDGEFLIVPQTGTLHIATEFGKLEVPPKFIAVIPRGVGFSVELTEDCRGWVCESFKGRFRLPDLGPIGANCLANPRDFECPSAWYEDKQGEYTVYNKFQGKLFQCSMDHSPYNAVGWHGNFYPYRYDLRKFCTIGSISFDHPDPSIFTVLTCPTDEPGTALCDFVIFPERWLVMENTFKPPYYHRNTMTEYMGNIAGVYDAKEVGFGPGCSSLHSCMTPHGPEAEVFEKASNVELKPVKLKNTLSFMFETCYMLKLFKKSADYMNVDEDYYKCWNGLQSHFTPPKEEKTETLTFH